MYVYLLAIYCWPLVVMSLTYDRFIQSSSFSAHIGLSQLWRVRSVSLRDMYQTLIPGLTTYSWGVYLNWMKIDPWMFIRLVWDLYHPRSVLSDTRLVHNAFFSEECPKETVSIYLTNHPVLTLEPW